ncbi:uncharacterized protein [Nicotiana sylvestris]|uniref:uncharacterized protein n=1 Tax=Nicotiana sylvestris TaxID=4096 RepID=UPI00388CD357
MAYMSCLNNIQIHEIANRMGSGLCVDLILSLGSSAVFFKGFELIEPWILKSFAKKKACYRYLGLLLEPNSLLVKVKWHPPPSNWYKFNFDGAFNNDCLHGGISGIIRNNKGEWILGYYEKCPIISPIKAKLLALRQALLMIIKENITHVFNGEGNAIGENHNEAQLP